MKTYIYGLYYIKDPKKEIRYVGKSDNPEKRLHRHLNNTMYNKKINMKLTHKEFWIISCDYEISYVILKECDKHDWVDEEKFFIKKYNNLTNTSSGGEGGSGLVYKINYEECKLWVKNNLNVKSKKDWSENIKKGLIPDNIPKNPSQRYKNDGWVSWGDFLGTGRICDNYVNYLNYDDAKKVIHNMVIKKVIDYRKLTKTNKIPHKIPNRPERYYKNKGWISWGDFLGSNVIQNQRKSFYSLNEFKIKMVELNIKTASQFKKYIKSGFRDMLIPTNPLIIYRRIDGNLKWSDFIS